MSIKICCFASGSKGNCTFVTDGETGILIDMGISATRAETCLKALGQDPDRVQVFVTHSHTDHVNGIKVFHKKHPLAAVHCQSESAPAICDLTGFMPSVDGREITVGSLTVKAVPVPHDVPCFGYTVEREGKRVAVVTDIGAVGADVLGALGSCDIVMLESNHDVEMLKHNHNYTPQLKARILSPNGHLSNPDCAAACGLLAERGVRNFILAHLSEENNNPNIAVSAVLAEMEKHGIFDAHVIAASQNRPTGLFEVC